MFQKLNSAIHDFAKKQENWFRRMEPRHAIHWLDGAGDPLAEALHVLAQEEPVKRDTAASTTSQTRAITAPWTDRGLHHGEGYAGAW